MGQYGIKIIRAKLKEIDGKVSSLTSKIVELKDEKKRIVAVNADRLKTINGKLDRVQEERDGILLGKQSLLADIEDLQNND